MFSLTRYETPCPEPINAQILQMVVDYLTDISMVAIPRATCCTTCTSMRSAMRCTCTWALGGSKGIAVELIVALDAQEQVIGFLLYLPVKDDPEACGVAYMAVHASHRRKGVARAMMQDMLARYPHAELTCAVEKVPAFESMGFQLRGVRGTQVLMNTRDYSTDGLMGLLDVASIYSSLEVRQIHTYLLQKHGKRAMIDAEKQRDRHFDQMTHKARMFVHARLG